MQDTGDDTYVIQPFKPDFSVPSMDKMVFLSVVGASSESRQTWISVFFFGNQIAQTIDTG